jgi:hypothetical protein
VPGCRAGLQIGVDLLGFGSAILVERHALILGPGIETPGWCPRRRGGDFDRVSRQELVTRWLGRLAPPPAGAFAYSNLGYSLLAAVVESVSGRRVWSCGRCVRRAGQRR